MGNQSWKYFCILQVTEIKALLRDTYLTNRDAAFLLEGMLSPQITGNSPTPSCISTLTTPATYLTSQALNASTFILQLLNDILWKPMKLTKEKTGFSSLYIRLNAKDSVQVHKIMNCCNRCDNSLIKSWKYNHSDVTGILSFCFTLKK